MRVKKTAVAMLALSAAIGVPAAGAAKPKHPSTAPAAKPAVKAPVVYVFRGVVAVAPGAGAASLQLQINSGNKAAMLKMGALAGNGNIQPVALGPGTTLVNWNAQNQPFVDPALTATIQVADPVAVTIVGAKNATLAQLFATPAIRVDDYLLSSKPHGRLFLFDGKAVAVDTVAHTITLNVLHTNWRAGYAMKTAAAPSTLTFTYDPAKTTFVHWNHGKQQLFTPDKIVVGDHVTIRIIPNNYESHLASLQTIAPWRVNDHEPMALVMKTIAANNTHKF
jgi:hypothetical protein